MFLNQTFLREQIEIANILVRIIYHFQSSSQFLIGKSFVLQRKKYFVFHSESGLDVVTW